ILLLERGDWLPREPQNWLAQDVFVDNRYISPDTWYDAVGKPFQPQVHYNVGGATKVYRAALYPLREGDVGELRHHRRRSPGRPGRSPTTSWSRTTRRPSRCTRCTARAAKIRPNLLRVRPIRSRLSPTSRGSSSSRTTSRPRATTRSTLRAESDSTSRTCPTARASVA